MKKIFLGSVVLTVLALACKKDENAATVNLSLTKYNLAGTYKTTAASFAPTGSTAEYDVFAVDSIFKACKKDDLLTFDTLNYYSYADSGVHCTPLGNTLPKQYSIATPNILNYDGSSFIVQSLTTSNLIISVDTAFVFSGFNLNGRFKITLTKQP